MKEEKKKCTSNTRGQILPAAGVQFLKHLFSIGIFCLNLQFSHLKGLGQLH